MVPHLLGRQVDVDCDVGSGVVDEGVVENDVEPSLQQEVELDQSLDRLDEVVD